MLRNARIECVPGQILLAGFKREAIPRNYQGEMARLGTDTAIALIDGDGFRRQDLEANPTAMAAAPVFDHSRPRGPASRA
jgi:hypothetical protein